MRRDDRRSDDGPSHRRPSWETIIGVLSLLGTLIGGGWTVYQGFDARLRAVEVWQSGATQKLDDIGSRLDAIASRLQPFQPSLDPPHAQGFSSEKKPSETVLP